MQDGTIIKKCGVWGELDGAEDEDAKLRATCAALKALLGQWGNEESSQRHCLVDQSPLKSG